MWILKQLTQNKIYLSCTTGEIDDLFQLSLWKELHLSITFYIAHLDCRFESKAGSKSKSKPLTTSQLVFQIYTLLLRGFYSKYTLTWRGSNLDRFLTSASHVESLHRRIHRTWECYVALLIEGHSVHFSCNYRNLSQRAEPIAWCWEVKHTCMSSPPPHHLSRLNINNI